MSVKQEDWQEGKTEQKQLSWMLAPSNSPFKDPVWFARLGQGTAGLCETGAAPSRLDSAAACSLPPVLGSGLSELSPVQALLVTGLPLVMGRKWKPGLVLKRADPAGCSMLPNSILVDSSTRLPPLPGQHHTRVVIDPMAGENCCMDTSRLALIPE